MKKQNDNTLMKIIGGFAALMIVIAIIIFLTNKDGGASGAAVLALEGGGFWFSAILFSVLGIVAVIAGLRFYAATQNAATIIIAIILAVVFLSIAWGKGCTDKANGGVTTQQGRPTK